LGKRTTDSLCAVVFPLFRQQRGLRNPIGLDGHRLGKIALDFIISQKFAYLQVLN